MVVDGGQTGKIVQNPRIAVLRRSLENFEAIVLPPCPVATPLKIARYDIKLSSEIKSSQSFQQDAMEMRIRQCDDNIYSRQLRLLRRPSPTLRSLTSRFGRGFSMEEDDQVYGTHPDASTCSKVIWEILTSCDGGAPCDGLPGARARFRRR
ncbi:hypothetical protein SCHPADRAFT_538470 [Schizopora paradoxa]|uniref:Uncharacterized protein n=1 Tax=Schizopora paradoxa TaxID=27342 RepID=A0A0H2RZ40_9AGAM|nr:hypothetical protein SCHPADRAFT_538470 [Schizopora paradoxa]